MAFAFVSRLSLSSREQRLVRVLLAVAIVTLFIGIPLGVESVVSTRRADNADMRQTLADVQAARVQIREKQAKKEAIVARYRERAPELGAFLEQGARKQKLDVTDSTDRPALPIGKRYIERTTVIHMKKSGLLALSKFFESIEQSAAPLSISRLSLRRRMGEPDAYDVEVGVSAWDRTEAATTPPTKASASATTGKAP
jgi:general secretion pathway protein M